MNTFSQSSKLKEREDIKMEQQISTGSISDSNSFEIQTFDVSQDIGVASFQLHLDCFSTGETLKEEIEVPNYIDYKADSLLQLPNPCGCNCSNCCSCQSCACNGNRHFESGSTNDSNLVESFSELIDDLSSLQAYDVDLDILGQTNQTQNILCFCSKPHAGVNNNEPIFSYSEGLPSTTHTSIAANIAHGTSKFESENNENKCCLIIDLNTLKHF